MTGRDDEPAFVGPEVEVPEAIDCIDCGGRCHLLGSHAGLATYRCSDCNDRWDVILQEDNGEQTPE
jgi:DNA-directed RNA polymerase subunit RPC12/RpoP